MEEGIPLDMNKYSLEEIKDIINQLKGEEWRPKNVLVENQSTNLVVFGSLLVVENGF